MNKIKYIILLLFFTATGYAQQPAPDATTTIVPCKECPISDLNQFPLLNAAGDTTAWVTQHLEEGVVIGEDTIWVKQDIEYTFTRDTLTDGSVVVTADDGNGNITTWCEGVTKIQFNDAFHPAVLTDKTVTFDEDFTTHAGGVDPTGIGQIKISGADYSHDAVTANTTDTKLGVTTSANINLTGTRVNAISALNSTFQGFSSIFSGNGQNVTDAIGSIITGALSTFDDFDNSIGIGINNTGGDVVNSITAGGGNSTNDFVNSANFAGGHTITNSDYSMFVGTQSDYTNINSTITSSNNSTITDVSLSSLFHGNSDVLDCIGCVSAQFQGDMVYGRYSKISGSGLDIDTLINSQVAGTNLMLRSITNSDITGDGQGGGAQTAGIYQNVTNSTVSGLNQNIDGLSGSEIGGAYNEITNSERLHIHAVNTVANNTLDATVSSTNGTVTDPNRRYVTYLNHLVLNSGNFYIGAPANSAAAGLEGEVRIDGQYIYWYMGGQWLRVAGSTF